MISATEVAQGTYGAWRLARCDSGGLQYFGDSRAAFWRSFYAALVAAPAYLILILFRLDFDTVSAGGLQILIVETLGYVAGWVAYPLLMFHAAESLGVWPRYYRYITAYNWSSVLQLLLFLAVALFTAGMTNTALGDLTLLVTIGAVLAYRWYIAKIGLGITGAAASALVMMDFMLGLVISQMTAALVY